MEQLYFIAIIPPENIVDEITQLKQEVAEKFGSRHALKSPPHITLHMPFKLKDSRLDALYTMMKELNEQMDPININLNGFDFFEPRVVFISVNENEELGKLQKLVTNRCRRDLKLDNANYRNQPFHPHITIGFRDLRKKAFYQAKEFYEKRSFKFEFEVDRIELLRHEGKRWEIIQNK